MQLTADNLTCERGGTRIFEGISFALQKGEGLLVTGPNGAGKSTLLRALAGLLPLADGTIKIDHAIHYLGPDNAMKPVLSVAENLRFWRGLYGGDGDINAALEKVDLPHVADAMFSDLSTGQKRRVAIAKLFMAHRPIWLLDEPTSGLDADAEKNFATIVKDHLTGGGIVIAATHLPIDVKGLKRLRFEGGAS